MSAVTLKWRREATAAGVLHGLSGNAKALWNLLATDYASDEGLAWPSAKRLARELGLSKRGIQQCKRVLIDAGRIIKVADESPGRAIVYRVLPWPVPESNGNVAVRPSIDNGYLRTVVLPPETDRAHNGVADGHTARRETGTPSCAISLSDPLLNHHYPPRARPHGG